MSEQVQATELHGAGLPTWAPDLMACVRTNLRVVFESPKHAIRYIASLTSLFHGSASDISVRSSSGSRRDDLSAAEIDHRLEAGMVRGLEITASLGGAEAKVAIAQDPKRPSEVGLDLPLSPIPLCGRQWLQCDPAALSPVRALAMPIAKGALTPEALHALVGLALRVGGFASAMAKTEDGQTFEWHSARPKQDAAPLEASLKDTTWKISGDGESAEAWFTVGQPPDHRKHPDESWWNAFDEFAAAPRSSLPELRDHLSQVFRIPFEWEFNELSNAPEVSDTITPEAGVVSRLVPTEAKLVLAVDFEQPTNLIADVLLHLCGHAELGHVQPGDARGHWDTVESVSTQSPHRQWDRDVAALLESVCQRPAIRRGSSIEECTPVEKAKLGLWRMIGEMLGESRRLHPVAERYQKAAYQRQAAQRMVAMLEDYGGAMLCDGVGLGKTYVATTLMVHYANFRRNQSTSTPDSLVQDPLRITVLAPNSVVSTWRREALPALASFGVPLATVRVISHTKLSRISRNSELIRPVRGGTSELEHLLLSDLVIVDEAHNFRSLSARRTKVLRDLLRLQPRLEQRRRVALLTATPLNNSLDDLRQEVSLLFSKSLLLSDAKTAEGYRRQAVREIRNRCRRARKSTNKNDLAPLIIHGQIKAKFSDTIEFREDLNFGPSVLRIGEYLKEQNKLLKELQSSIRDAAQNKAPQEDSMSQVRIAEELLDRVVVQRSRTLCKEIEQQQSSNIELLFRPNAEVPEKLYYSDEYDGIEDALSRFLPLFDSEADEGNSKAKPLSLKVYMWYDVSQGFKTANEMSSVVGLQRVLMLKRLESSPVSFLITLLRLNVLHAHRLQQLINICMEVKDNARRRTLEAELKAILERQKKGCLAKLQTLALGETYADPRRSFLKSLSKAYSTDRPIADTDDPLPQMSLHGEEAVGGPKHGQLDRLWSLRSFILSDFETLLAVTPDLADIVFGKFDRAEWPRQFISGGESIDWPQSPQWGLRVVTDAKIRQLISRLVLARRVQQKTIVFSQFSDTIAYIRSVLTATQNFERSDWQIAVRGLGVPKLTRDELVSLREATAAITGDTENRDEVVNAFAPFYRIGPWRPATENTTEIEQSLLFDSWETAWQSVMAREIDILISSDVLAEGVNLQDAALLINFDVHWNPVRMIQRSGRIDRRLNPRIEQPHEFPDLAALAARAGKPVPRYYWHDHPDEAPVTVNLILPDELEAELQLRERIATKTMAIDFTLGLEQGTGAEADWMENYKYHGITSLNSFQKDRAIEQIAGHHERLSRHFVDLGIQTKWLEDLNAWFRSMNAGQDAPLVARALMSHHGEEPERFTRYLEPAVVDGIPHWCWADKRPGDSIYDGWLVLDGKTWPPPPLRRDIPFHDNAAGPVKAAHLLAALEYLDRIHDLEEWSKSNKGVGRLLLQGGSAIAAPKLGQERQMIRIPSVFILQLPSFDVAQTKPSNSTKPRPTGPRRGISRVCLTCGHTPGMHKCCARCKTTADGEEDIDRIFGFRVMSDSRGETYEVPQPWCRSCRTSALSNTSDRLENKAEGAEPC